MLRSALKVCSSEVPMVGFLWRRLTPANTTFNRYLKKYQSVLTCALNQFWLAHGVLSTKPECDWGEAPAAAVVPEEAWSRKNTGLVYHRGKGQSSNCYGHLSQQAVDRWVSPSYVRCRPFKGRAKLRVPMNRVLDTYTTGKTFGKTTLASAKYSYRIRWSNSSVVYFTNVACYMKKD